MVATVEREGHEVREPDGLETDAPGKAITRILAAARERLGMEIAFVSQFRSGQRVFRFIEGALDVPGVEVDGADPLEESFCLRVVRGELPSLIHDAGTHEGTKHDPVTAALGIGAHLSVPIHLSDGRVFGTFCCFSRVAAPGLTERDVEFMRLLADLVAEEIERLDASVEHDHTSPRIHAAIDAGPRMVFQPIVDVRDGSVAGFEALARFDMEPSRTPDVWFQEAWSVGLGLELELSAVQHALTALPLLGGDRYLSLNVAPETAMSPRLAELLAEVDPGRVVLELTEHARIDSFPPVLHALADFRARGIRVALDDVGSGYAGLISMLNLRPDIIKLDRAVASEIDDDPLKQSLARATVQYARDSGGVVVAEGVETERELGTLASLGVSYAQGYHCGRPGPLV